MLIYGSRAAHLQSYHSQDAICDSCNTQGEIVFSVFRRHAHVFWIPMFPIGKTGVAQCQHCKKAYEVKQMSPELRSEYFVIQKESKGPIWQFAGLMLIGVLVVVGHFSSKADKEKELTYIAAPEVGDVYEYKVSPNRYSTMKVVDVSADSVFVSENDYEVNKMTGIYKIDKDINYSPYTYGITRSMIKSMYDSGEIYDVNRSSE
jgi:hypothetical protein